MNYCDPGNDVPAIFMPRGRWKSGPMHTFCDDYRQEFFWRRPEEGLIVALSAGVVTAPDFTVWNDDPKEWANYQAWRSALVAAYWSLHGVCVMPVVSFGTSCANYVKPGSAWSVRGPSGQNDDEWCQAVEAWAKSARPAMLVVFGREPNFGGGLSFAVELRRLVSGKGVVIAAQKEGSDGR